jgi:hypothetical protein
MGGLKLSKKAGDGPKWWNHENDSSAASRGAVQWRRGRVICWCARCAGRPRCGLLSRFSDISDIINKEVD